MRRHPIIYGFLLLMAVGIAVFVVVFGITNVIGNGVSFSLKDKVGVVYIKGEIKDSIDIIQLLDRYMKADDIKAVVVRIDSAGGSVVPSQEIYDKVLELKKEKTVVASLGSVAASGGYYIACAADRIVANPGTITGSIGVIIQLSQIQELLSKIGLKATVIKAGKYKDIGSPIRDITAEEKKLIQSMVDDIYDQFLSVVVENRNIPLEKVRHIADGKIYTGRQSYRIGLIDDLGNMEYSINLAAKLANIEGPPKVIYPEKEYTGLLKYLIGNVTTAFYDGLHKAGIDTGLTYGSFADSY